MAYINTTTGVYPYRVAMLRRDYPQTSFPSQPTDALLAEFGVYPVARADRPDHDPIHQVVAEQPPALVDGVWTQQWEVRDLTAPELAVMREQLHRDRRARRTQAETGGFTFGARRIDSDRDSVLRLTQAALVASQALAADQPFAVEWVCADDSVLPLDAAGMLAMQAAITAHGLACHNRSQALRTLIDGAPDGPALSAAANAIATGWPE